MRFLSKSDLAIFEEYQKRFNFLAEMFYLVEKYEAEVSTKEIIRDKVIDLQQIMHAEIRGPLQEQRIIKLKKELLKQFQVESTEEVLAQVLNLINKKYNQTLNPQEKWLDLKTELLDYQVRQKKELKNLDENVRNELLQGEQVLEEIVLKLNPCGYAQRGELDVYDGDYARAKILLQKRIKSFDLARDYLKTTQKKCQTKIREEVR